ncbi:MAG: hypothetical protein H6658_00800 [Ardenticatenaceae bacterium]|nr:hypothetical protein [Ardenticatenaceae bacterium]
MNNKITLKFLSIFALSLLLLTACGSKTVTLSDIPGFTGATELVPGEDPIADTMVQNMQQDAQLRTEIGVGGSVEQKAYRLPVDASWDSVKSFYANTLEGDGWKSGLGGPGGDLASSILESANAGNDLFQTAVWSRGDQNITVIRTADPTNAENAFLILSLASN